MADETNGNVSKIEVQNSAGTSVFSVNEIGKATASAIETGTIQKTNGQLALAATGTAPGQSIITAATNGTERLRVDASGNVGIGTLLPDQLLTVAGTIESTLSGFKFPDAKVQTTAAVTLDPLVFGDGSDGDLVVSTDLLISSDMNFRDLTVQPGITLSFAGGVVIRGTGTLTLNGLIKVNGTPGQLASPKAGRGGDSGGCLYLFFNKMSGSGNITTNGEAGLGATGASSASIGGASGTSGTFVKALLSLTPRTIPYNVTTNNLTGSSVAGASGSNAIGGSGGSGAPTQFDTFGSISAGVGGSGDNSLGKPSGDAGGGGGSGGFLMIVIKSDTSTVGLSANAGNGGNGFKSPF